MIYDYFHNITFAYPWVLLLLAVLPILIWWNFGRGQRRKSAMEISTLQGVNPRGSLKILTRHIPFILRVLALACIIFALARPQVRFEEQQREGEGIDIILCIDVSGSMTAEDLKPNRMEAAKRVAIDFVNHRPNDRIGVVIFAGESFTQCPLTTDHNVLISQIQAIGNGLLEDGTSIGSGLATSVDRLRNSKAKSKVVILLTDGVNNGGLIDPLTALQIAKVFHVKVYTIGVGSQGYAPTPINTPLGTVMQQEKVTIDEKLLKDIASQTGGRYFRATDNTSLQRIYAEINQLEKTKVKISTFERNTEKFYPFLFAALALLFIEALLRYLVFKKFP